MKEFVEYVLGFYGENGIYDMGATKEEILVATGIRIERKKDIPFQGDTLDREMVRDIILEARGEA